MPLALLNSTFLSPINLDWPVTSDITIFHQHQGFPSTEDFADYYITSQQGIRMKIMGNFTTSFHINWRYDNTPSTGKKASDFQYLFNLDYRAPLKTRHFGEGKEATRGKPECMGEYMRI